MQVFGHAGLTTGLVLLINSFPVFRSRIHNENLSPGDQAVGFIPRKDSPAQSNFIDQVDLRVVIIGSLLPDIIDKPVGTFFFKETFYNGRIFSHSLMFLILISLAGIFLYKRHKTIWWLGLSFGTLTHLIFDEMWLAPQTLFWPLHGFTFPKTDITNWIPNSLHQLITNPLVYIPELVGAAVLVFLTIRLLRRRTFFDFLKHGRLR
jgi:inner membrane protein